MDKQIPIPLHDDGRLKDPLSADERPAAPESSPADKRQDELLSNIEMAFHQDDLENLFRRNEKTICLVSGCFQIPPEKAGLQYIYVDSPTVSFLQPPSPQPCLDAAPSRADGESLAAPSFEPSAGREAADTDPEMEWEFFPASSGSASGRRRRATSASGSMRNAGSGSRRTSAASSGSARSSGVLRSSGSGSRRSSGSGSAGAGGLPDAAGGAQTGQPGWQGLAGQELVESAGLWVYCYGCELI